MFILCRWSPDPSTTVHIVFLTFFYFFINNVREYIYNGIKCTCRLEHRQLLGFNSAIGKVIAAIRPYYLKIQPHLKYKTKPKTGSNGFEEVISICSEKFNCKQPGNQVCKLAYCVYYVVAGTSDYKGCQKRCGKPPYICNLDSNGKATCIVV